MKVTNAQLKKWATKSLPVPKLSNNNWNVATLVAVVFLTMATLQVIDYTAFKDWVKAIGIGGGSSVAMIIILAEVGAALAFLKTKMSYFSRLFGALLALLASGFWFFQNIRLISDGSTGPLSNSGYFGRFLEQAPSWLTAVEATVLIVVVVYVLELMREDLLLKK
jgi:hypothetical protein